MSIHTVQELAEHMKGIDIAVLSTTSTAGAINARPMSNNGDVEYDGDSFYFTDGDTQKVKDIEQDRRVALSFTGKPGLISKGHFYVIVRGQAELIRDRQQFEAHWSADLDKWFEQGADTPGLVLIKVRAEHIRYWDGTDQGELEVDRK